MALVACLECNHQVSDKAASCPKCGCPINSGRGNSSTSISKTNNTVNCSVGFFNALEGFTMVPKTVCPHCQKRGCVITKKLKAKKGVSGGKVTAGLFTFGLSLLAVGLSRMEWVTQAKCRNCESEWQF